MLYNVLPIKEYFESDGALRDAFMKSTIQSNNLRKRTNNHTRETARILPLKERCYGAKACSRRKRNLEKHPLFTKHNAREGSAIRNGINFSMRALCHFNFIRSVVSLCSCMNH